jgi:ABC-type transport system involved in multi-copper enzyme maturation permease subunit
LLGSLSFAEQLRIKYDLGLAGVELTTMLVSAVISTHALYRDIDRKTFQVILARPILRWHLLASYLGSLAILNTILVVFLGTTMAVFFGVGILFSNFLVVLITILLKSIVVGAFGIAICTVVRPMFGLVMTIAYWILAYSVSDIKFFLDKVDPEISKVVIGGLNWTVPQFYLFNWKSYAFLTSELAFREVIWSWFHCFGWIFLLLFTASLLIRRKDIV